MNLYKYIKENIDIEKTYKLSDDKYEIAIVRMMLKELSKFFYRDYIFFLNKENLQDRKAIYNKEFDLSNIEDFEITCKSYCQIVKKILKEVYNIDSELISSFDDEYRHIDLLIETSDKRKYIIDPLSDLIEMKVGLKTNNFASKEYYESSYSKIIDEISFLTDEDLEEIDNIIGYKNNGIYLDEILEDLKFKTDHIEEILEKDEQVSMDLLGKKYNGEKFTDDEKIELKFKYINKYFDSKKNINGIVDLLMFTNYIIKKVFSKEEQEKISVNGFFVDKEDIKDDEIKASLTNNENRKRGIVVKINNKNYIISLGPTVLEYSDDEWKEQIDKNNIFVRQKYPIKLSKYLKTNGVDRNIVHNNEFLRLFNKFENILLDSGESLEDIKKNNVAIKNGMVLTRFGKNRTLYKIEDGNLVIEDYERNIRNIVFYKDEGRYISYKKERILKDINPKETDIYKFFGEEER